MSGLPAPAPPSPDGADTPLLLRPLADEVSDRRRAIRVGVTAIVSLVVLSAALLVTGPIRVLSGPRVRVDFGFCGPIKPGASVRLAGAVVGVVEDVELLAGRDPEAGPDAMVRVHARVRDEVAHLITADTQFYVTTLGVLGEHYLDVAPAPSTPPKPPLPDGARVDGVTLARADLLLPRASALLDRADTLLPDSPELHALLSTTSSLLTTLDDLLRDDGNQALLKDGVDDVRALVTDLRGLVKGAAFGVGDGRALRNALEALPPAIDKASRVADVAIQSELAAFVRDARAVLSKSAPLVDALAKGPASDPDRQQRLAEKLESTLRALDAAATRADRLLGQIEAKKGAAGKLFHDEALADDLKNVLHQVREDPVRFLLR